MAAIEREIPAFKIDFKRILNLAGKVKVAAKSVLADDRDGNWTIIDGKDLTPEKEKQFIKGRGGL